jgi:hypothetical protein
MYLTEYMSEIMLEQFPPEQPPAEEPVDSFEPMKKFYLYAKLKPIKHSLMDLMVNSEDQQDDINDLIYYIDLLLSFYNVLSYQEIIILLSNFFEEAKNILKIQLPEDLDNEIDREMQTQNPQAASEVYPPQAG